MSDIGASGVGRVHCSASELVVLVLEQDVERGERSVTARHDQHAPTDQASGRRELVKRSARVERV